MDYYKVDETRIKKTLRTLIRKKNCILFSLVEKKRESLRKT